ncbi:MAG: addiction module antidote protein, HigA family [Chloroflexi bacterium]|nr:MAG: addiction module antidote protein, HigA family [Chloroflexota bacterium]
MNKIKNQFRPDYVSIPGETLLETLETIGMSQAELANRMGRPKKTINEIIQGKTAITAETALQLALVLGVPASFWLNREQQYQEAKARIAEEEQLENQTDWLETAHIPVKQMCKWGWIAKKAEKYEQLKEVLRFYGVASVKQWNVVYDGQDVRFRQSQARPILQGAVTAWLRKGELDAHAIDCAPYDKKQFQQTLHDIRAMTRQPVETIWSDVVQQCAAAGVAVVLVPAFPNTGVSGATRWLSKNKAILQLSLRYKRDDQLWFSFFHEAGHILKHSKKKLFLEPDKRPEDVNGDELAADKFASDFLIPPAKLIRFTTERKYFSYDAVSNFADQIGIAPGIVVGRLQHDGNIPLSHLNKLKRPLKWGTWVSSNARDISN